MRTPRTNTVTKNLISATLLLAIGLAGAARTASAGDLDFSNPGVAITADAIIASGACIAKYAALLDDGSMPAAEVGKRVANQCSTLISRSAGMAALVSGKPDAFASDLQYMRDALTTNAVVRLRAAGRN
jgi:hypothetical protein